MSTPWKDPRTGTFYIRRGVPADLREKLGWTYKRSLRTKDPKEAKTRFTLELAKCEQLFKAARQNQGEPERSKISREEAERLADAWLAMLLEEDEEVRMEGLDGRGFRKVQETLDIVDVGGRQELAHGDTSLVEFEVEDFIASYGLRIAKGSDAFRQLCFAFLKASVKANELALKRQQGEVVDTPPVPAPDGIAGRHRSDGEDGVPISEVYTRWKAERRPGLKLTNEWDKAMRRFQELHGDLAINAITRRQVSAFKDSLLKMPSRPAKAIRELPLPEIVELVGADPNMPKLKPASIKKDLAAIHAIMAWAVENGYRDDNPATGIRIRVAKNEDDDRLPYDVSDLQLIFGSSVYAEGFRPRGGAGEAAYWLPLLALFTGARLDELGALRASDVRSEGDIWFLDINTLDEGKSVKTKSSRRKVPIHAELVRLGFPDYVETRRVAGDKVMLFHDLRPDRSGVITGNWSKWWGRYARSIGIADPRKVFHSLRHTFKTECRIAGIGKEFHDAITGHRSGDVGDDYGRQYPVDVLAREIAKVRYRDLDLSHLG